MSRANAIIRSTYTAKNAARFLPWFREVIKQGKDIFIKQEHLGMTSVRTLAQRAAEASLWLTQEDLSQSEMIFEPYEDNEYWLKFKRAIKFRPQIEHFVTGEHDPGIWFLWRIPCAYAFKNIVARGAKPIDQELVRQAIEDSNKEIIHPEAGQVEVAKATNAADWKADLVAFINDSEKKMYIKEGLNLSQEDMNWVYDVLGGLNVEKLVRSNSVRIMRG